MVTSDGGKGGNGPSGTGSAGQPDFDYGLPGIRSGPDEVYGFGPERIARFRGAMEAVVLEYGGLMDAVDTEYADDKLAERYEAIMGDLAYPEVSS